MLKNNKFEQLDSSLSHMEGCYYFKVLLHVIKCFFYRNLEWEEGTYVQGRKNQYL
jgi:hypothetical protein